MKDKYFDEQFPEYFINGTNINDSNLVFITNGQYDVFENVPKNLAEQIVEDHNKMVNKLKSVIMQISKSHNPQYAYEILTQE